ncbi:MAG: hypothetical protein ACRD0G_00630 [Acidimicrobiales bacterium]
MADRNVVPLEASTTSGRARKLTADRLAELASWNRPPCVSIYVPLDPVRGDATRIRLKDLARTARNELERLGAAGRLIDELLTPVTALEGRFGEASGHRGIAMFTAPGIHVACWLGADLPARADAGKRFVVTPLVAALPANRRYHLLALSQHDVRLFRGNHAGLSPVEVGGMPRNVAEALWYEDPDRRVSWHGGAQVGRGRVAMIAHGSGSERDVHSDRLLRFFRAVDDSVATVLHAPTAPLLVAGVDYELAFYRQATRVASIVTVSLGNTDLLSAAELQDRCQPAIRTLLDRPRVARLRRLARLGAPATSLPEVLAACAESRVDTLFVRADALTWGAADGDGSDAHEQRVDGDVELYGVAIGAALRRGATVFPAWPGELPGDAPIAASLRF